MFVTLLSWVVVIAMGALAGWLASKIMGTSNQGVLMDVLFGIGGSVVGGWLAGWIGFNNNALLWQLLFAVIGAVILIAIKMLIMGRKPA